MSLIRFARLLRRDDGSTMVPVIGLVAVAGIVTALIATVSVQALAYTTLNRAGVQAQAAADAGVEFMRAQLATGTCPPGNSIQRTYGEVFTGTAGIAELARLGIDGTQPYFDVSTEYQTWSADILLEDWTDGCPGVMAGPGLSYRVRILSTGFASARAVGGAGGLDARTVEAIHSWDLGTLTSTIVPTGPAVYSYGTVDLNANTDFISFNGSQPNVLVRHGDLVCDSNTEGIVDLVIADGDVRIRGNCDVDGSVWASKSATLTNNSTVEGNVVAAEVEFFGRALVRGSVWASGSVDSEFAMSRHVLGTVHANVPTDSMPQIPFVPEWIDLDYDPADWDGFTVVPMSGVCDAHKLRATLAATPNEPLLIDARGCNASGVTMGANEVVHLDRDIAIFAHRFNLGTNGKFQTSTDSRLWIVQPDETAALPGQTPQPHCGGRSDVVLESNFKVSLRTQTLIYSPCRVRIDANVDFRGQIYAGQVSLASNTDFTFDPVGFPGADLDTGEVGGGLVSTSATLGALQSYRGVAG